jgi:hypothetical protein
MLIDTGKVNKNIPIIVNAHLLEKTDLNGEHKTIYNKNWDVNTKYLGKSLFEIMLEDYTYFKEEYKKTFVFDGDTIEFITNNFYKTKVRNVCKELKTIKNMFILYLNIFFKKYNLYSCYGVPFIWKINHPFVTLLTNFNKCSIFNNMTYHFNFTLPTKLNNKWCIENMDLFINQHKNAIHFIQLIEPVIVSIYGSGDILSDCNWTVLTNCWQRCAKSRYIGIGTYDTNTMKKGKILQINSKDNHLSNNKNWWFNQYYNKWQYTMEDNIGLDINFNKYHNHGIELRFLDYFDESKLPELLHFFV